jgi:fructose-1,6-bisphosphatase/inositol monophosphatase family enzyme
VPEAEWLAAAREAAATAAAFIAAQAATRHDLVWEEKSDVDFVSAVDIGAEERIGAVLASRLPTLRVIGEELGPTGDASTGFVAIVDPLDGTTNFLHGIRRTVLPSASPSMACRVGVVHEGARRRVLGRGGPRRLAR